MKTKRKILTLLVILFCILFAFSKEDKKTIKNVSSDGQSGIENVFPYQNYFSVIEKEFRQKRYKIIGASLAFLYGKNGDKISIRKSINNLSEV